MGVAGRQGADMTPAEKNLTKILGAWASFKPPAPRPRPVTVRECEHCDGIGYAEGGGRCLYCGGHRRIANNGGEP